MSFEYPTFSHNNELVILKPGEQFTINELKLRLRLMGIDANNIQNKTYLLQLYESSLNSDEKKIQIFNKLKKDTEEYNFNLNNRNKKNMVQMEINNKPYNDKVQLKRANKITEDNFNYSLSEKIIINDDKIKSKYKGKKVVKKIVKHVLSGFVIISSALGVLYVYRIYSEKINKNISKIFATVSGVEIYWIIFGIIFMLIFLLIVGKLIQNKNKKNGHNKSLLLLIFSYYLLKKYY